MLENTASRERDLSEKLQQYEKLLEERDNLLKSYINSDDELTIISNLHVILGKFQTIENRIKYENSRKELQKSDGDNQEPSIMTVNQELTYSSIAAREVPLRQARKNPELLSKSAILISRTNKTKS